MMVREEVEKKEAKEESITVIDTGNHAASLATKFARVQVIAAYPITPQTQIVEEIAKFVEYGKMNAKYVRVESEHSAMAACIGASAVGTRVFTATSSQGLLLMHEMLFAASAYRLPIVMANVNRALFPPWIILAEHTDSLAQRDTGWIQYYCSSNQEVFDTVLQAYRVAESVNLPVMVNLEGFIMSHTHMPIVLPAQRQVDEFLPPRKPLWKLDVNNPQSFGNLAFSDYYVKMRKSIEDGMVKAKSEIEKATNEFEKIFGRNHGGLIDCYRCEDAETIIFALSTLGKEAKASVDSLREKGVKCGVARIRVFRPFPEEKIKEIAASAENVVILDRDNSFGKGGILSTEVRSILEGKRISNFIIGMGGMDVPYTTIEKCVEKSNGQKDEWIMEARI